MWYIPFPPTTGAQRAPDPEPPFMMSDDDLNDIERCAGYATEGTWELQTSNSIRRIGTQGADGCVMHATQSRHDGVIDLGGPYANLEYIVRMQPQVACHLVAELKYHRDLAARRQREEALNHEAADGDNIGRGMDGAPQPYAGAIVLLETIAEFGAVPFIDGKETEMRKLCKDFAAQLRHRALTVQSIDAIQKGSRTEQSQASRPQSGTFTCGLCGTVGLHACPGTPLEPMSDEKLRELDEALSRAEVEEAISRGEDPANSPSASTPAPTLPIRFDAGRAIDVLNRTAAWIRRVVGIHEPGLHVARTSLVSAISTLESCRGRGRYDPIPQSLSHDLELLARWIDQLPLATTTKANRLMMTTFVLEWVNEGMLEPGVVPQTALRPTE